MCFLKNYKLKESALSVWRDVIPVQKAYCLWFDFWFYILPMIKWQNVWGCFSYSLAGFVYSLGLSRLKPNYNQMLYGLLPFVIGKKTLLEFDWDLSL